MWDAAAIAFLNGKLPQKPKRAKFASQNNPPGLTSSALTYSSALVVVTTSLACNLVAMVTGL